MTGHFTLSAVRELHRRTTKEAPHTLAVVVFTVRDGYCFGVVDGASGDCLAWDGMYFDEDTPQTTPLDQLDWDEWGDMASKYVLETQREWLAGPLGFWLMPSYSIAKEAAELVDSWSERERGDDRVTRGGTVVCYLPVYDHDAYEAHLAKAKEERQKIEDLFR